MSASIGQRPRGRQRVSFLPTHPPTHPTPPHRPLYALALCSCPCPGTGLTAALCGFALSLSLLVSAALAEAASDSTPEADDVTVFDPTARDKETLAKAVAADLKAVGLSLSF